MAHAVLDYLADQRAVLRSGSVMKDQDDGNDVGGQLLHDGPEPRLLPLGVAKDLDSRADVAVDLPSRGRAPGSSA